MQGRNELRVCESTMKEIISSWLDRTQHEDERKTIIVDRVKHSDHEFIIVLQEAVHEAEDRDA